ncbi:MAG: transposase [Candidatus Heimdallarchaeota archaeon]|nr:transposase [Candidatus Heimdallarchaeota archaeon]
MTPILKNYLFKLVLPNKQKYLENFKELIDEATKQTLEKLWTEEWIEKLGRTTTKAHNIVTAGRVVSEQEGKKVYLPSRVRMCIAERVGRILRSQYRRMRCYYDCLSIMEIVGIEESETKLRRLIAQSIRDYNHNGYYKKVLLLHTIRMIKNWHQELKIDFQMVSYCDLVKPSIKNFTFPYGPDNYRELDYEVKNNQIWYKIRIPTIIESTNINDWTWVEGIIPIPEKIQQRISESINHHPKKPRMIIKTLKGGKEYFFLQFPWEFEEKKNEYRKPTRILAVDLGVKKIATAVVCEKGKQLSKPIYLKISPSQYEHIERLYKHRNGILKFLDVNPQENKRFEEKARINRKLLRIKLELVQTTTNILIELTKQWHCEKIALEDLRTIRPKKGTKKWSRQLNDWLHGQITKSLTYKCREERIELQKVIPWGTSTHCARCCNTTGQTIIGASNKKQRKGGRWFYCPKCGFNTDRDYNGALNIYRASFINNQEIKSLKDTSPITYMEVENPSPNCSWRRFRDEPTTTQIVLVTGG